MNLFRPFAVLAGLALVAVIIVTLGIYALRSDDNRESAEPTSTPEVASPTPTQVEEYSDDQNQSEVAPDPTPDDDVDPFPTPDASASGDADIDYADVSNESETEQETLSEEELQRYQPNELGKVLVLMYHRIEPDADPNDVWTRTPDQFRGDLQWLYDNDFYVIPIRDYVRNEINAPAGKRPVILTFDDGTVGQFRMIEHDDGSLEIDPDSAVGILEEFFERYDDFGRGGLFSILPLSPFSWPDAEGQYQYAGEKLKWLVDIGYELGNHTVSHVNLREILDEEIKSELARAEDMIVDYVPDAEVIVLAVPFGIYPVGGDTSIFEGWEYEGREYELEAALMVGAEPSPSPVHTEFDPMWIPRINADDQELRTWFRYVEDNPGIIYVSDGNPDTITIPEQLHPGLVDTLDEAKAGGKTIIRY
jgi:peptidoglycan/xylan/chitin deacetylase (PgdA/CDA1 family)